MRGLLAELYELIERLAIGTVNQWQ
jgi:hypothetical protein